MRWTWAAASCRGTSHAKHGIRRQDAFSCFSSANAGDTFFAVVSDGAGSATKGGEGASLTCRIFASRARAHFALSLGLPSEDLIRSWLDETRDRISQAAEKRVLEPRDFAATLICAISSGSETLVAHVGDGCAVVQSAETSNWIAASWPDQGEYASTTFFVTDDPEPRLRISRHEKLISAIVVFTDGIERLALDLAANQPHKPFFDGIIRPVVETSVSGRDPALSRMLSTFLNGDTVNERTDDDKTVVLAVRR